MRVAVVHNTIREGVLAPFGQRCPETYGPRHIERVAWALREGGHTVICLEGDKRLLSRLERFLNSVGINGPGGMVFNMAYGIQGECRYTHVPAMLEMAGVPYTGSSPLGHALALDKVITKVLLENAGVPTPAYAVLGRAEQARSCTLRYPLVVKPRHESTSLGLFLVHDAAELGAAVSAVVERFGQEALVEEYIDGREVCVGLLGNDPAGPGVSPESAMEVLPLVEVAFGDRPLRLVTWEDKLHKRYDEPGKVCPAPVEAARASSLGELARRAFQACHCRDYARVDVRIDPEGRPFVLEINSMASLGDTGSFVLATETAGMSFTALVNRIVEVTHLRYFGRPASLDKKPTAEAPKPAECGTVGSYQTAGPGPANGAFTPALADPAGR